MLSRMEYPAYWLNAEEALLFTKTHTLGKGTWDVSLWCFGENSIVVRKLLIRDYAKLEEIWLAEFWHFTKDGIVIYSFTSVPSEETLNNIRRHCVNKGG